MLQRDYDTLAACVDVVCRGEGKKDLHSDRCRILIEEILIAAFEDTDNRDKFLELIGRLRTDCFHIPTLVSANLGNFGYRCYQLHSPALAEWVYRYALELNDSIPIRNNLAYILRHHCGTFRAADTEIIDLLLEGVRRQDAFSLINMALHYALNLSSQDDWLLADRLIKLVEDENLASAYRWWSDMAINGEPEGMLVMHWLNRNHKLPVPLDQTGVSWVDQIKKHYREVPSWLFDPPAES